MMPEYMICPDCGKMAYHSSHFKAFICGDCGWFKYAKVPTHGDRIRAMPDEEMAKALHEIFCDGMIYGLQSTAGDWHGAKKESDFLALLRQPINEEEENR